MTEKKDIPFGEAVTKYKACANAIGDEGFEKYGVYKEYKKAERLILDKINDGIEDQYLHHEFVTEADLITAAFEELDYVARCMSANDELSDEADAVLTAHNIAAIAEGDITINEPNPFQIFRDLTRNDDQGFQHIKNAFKFQAAKMSIDIDELSMSMKNALRL